MIQSAQTFALADTNDYERLLGAFQGCDAVIHMAAIPSPDRHPNHIVHNNNVTGSYNVMRAAIECGITRICQASSVNAIGLSYSRVAHFDYFPIDENHPNYSEEPYGLSKWICEQQAIVVLELASSSDANLDNVGLGAILKHIVVLKVARPERGIAESGYVLGPATVDFPERYVLEMAKSGGNRALCERDSVVALNEQARCAVDDTGRSDYAIGGVLGIGLLVDGASGTIKTARSHR